MSNLYIHAQMSVQQLLVDSAQKIANFTFSDQAGNEVELPLIAAENLPDGQIRYRFNAAQLQPWTPETPVLYFLSADGATKERFGMVDLQTIGNKTVLLNGNPYFFRGYIRGIVAHDHPNLSGKSLYESYVYHIKQAKKYGFNLVRFHSTVPAPEFIQAADELGLFIHMEIGFAYSYDKEGHKQGLALDNAEWRETILKYRSNPSVAIFCIGNEMHNSGHVPMVHELFKIGKNLAPDKLIMDNSGWGEFDRSSADIYSQHIAYYYPFKHHQEMFKQDFCWHLNGSMYDTPLEAEKTVGGIKAAVRRTANPLKPTLAHEAMHYIEIPDYEKLNQKFDDFAAKVGPEYLAANGIKKPRYMTDLPALIAKKNLQGKIKDYQLASQKSKKIAFKTYIERLRLSQLNGFEMLQFADCFKYENKNGLVDCFDDDKYIDPEWFKQFNGADALLLDQSQECYFSGEKIALPLYLSHFSATPNPVGELKLTLDDGTKQTEIYAADKVVAVPGVQKLLDLNLELPATATAKKWVLRAEFKAPEFTCCNDWEFRVLPRPEVQATFNTRFSGTQVPQFLAKFTAGGAKKSAVILTDRLDQKLFDDLKNGQTVVLFYHRDNPDQAGFYLPGSFDRYKPCIWDRGNNLGGIVAADFVQKALACDRYFGAEFQPLCEAGYKLNLDHFPGKITELISGVDKPVRDRMKGMLHHIKEFQEDDTLRNFCYLGAFQVGQGRLLISTFSTAELQQPAPANYVAAVLNNLDNIEFASGLTFDEFYKYATTSPVIKEDVMNHFWEIDNKPVEDTLFWEQTGIDLSKIK